MMYYVFYKTSDVFEGEEILNDKGLECEVVPTPVQDKAYCGVCLKVDDSSHEIIEFLLENLMFKHIGDKRFL